MSSEPSSEEFFIGWQGKAPPQTGRFLRGRIVLILVATLVLGAILAASQGTIGRAWFQFGDVREFHGLLVREPVPMLLTESPDPESGESVYLLVSPFKYGYPAEEAERFHLQPVTIQGTLIYNEESGGAMIEAVETVPREGAEAVNPLSVVAERKVTLEGEIVDSKCWLGVMNPGSMKPHRACAINCIRGGIPPVLLVDRRDLFVMVGTDGEAINESILPLVALPVSMEGTVVDYGPLKVIKVDPDAIQLVGEGSEDDS